MANINLDTIQKHAQIVKNIRLKPSLWFAVYEREHRSLDADEALYNGFVQDDDRNRLNSLRNTANNELSVSTALFKDERLNELFFRYRARHFFDSLSSKEQIRWKSFCCKKANLKLESFWTEFDNLMKGATETEKSILLDIRLWVEETYFMTFGSICEKLPILEG